MCLRLLRAWGLRNRSPLQCIIIIQQDKCEFRAYFPPFYYAALGTYRAILLNTPDKGSSTPFRNVRLNNVLSPDNKRHRELLLHIPMIKKRKGTMDLK